MGYAPKPIIDDINKRIDLIKGLMELGMETSYDMAIKLAEEMKKDVEMLSVALAEDKKIIASNRDYLKK